MYLAHSVCSAFKYVRFFTNSNAVK
uniref:Uncharacterized protein n=1 Tax=Rhizophora mucronata TaxID=61149 RepID=A0A2P2M3F1_RHIMU